MASSESTGQAPPRAVHHELRTAENSTGYLLGALKAMHTANPHLKLLDVGAGSGSISATLARAIQPDGHVTATDRDPTILPRAQVLAERTGAAVAGNMTFRQADVFALPFADASFDVTHCHQVLTHLPRPADALREMLRVTRPGGLVAAREGDLETECVWPELPALLKFHDLCARSMTLAGGTAKAGRQLLSWALEAGVPRDHITPSLGTWYYHDPTERKVWGKLNCLILFFCLF